LHAAQGKISARAHKNQAKLAAKTEVRIASTTATVELAAPNKHLLATAAGAYLKIDGGNIELAAPGTVEFKGSQRDWTGAKVVSIETPSLPKSEWKNWIDLEVRGWEAAALAGVKYKITFEDGSTRSGQLDDKGYAHIESVPPHGKHKVEYENEGEDPPAYTLDDLAQSIKQYLGA
jgi:type VI secretion system secreted protein VgrG